MKLPSIVGIAGTNGSGKDALGALLQEKYDYTTVSLSDILRAELDTQGKPHTRENLSGLSKQIREAEGDGAMSRRVMDQYGTVKLCITSIRTPGEVEVIQQAGGIVVWIDADEHIRYNRVQNSNRGRGVTDMISFEEFQAQQVAEMAPTAQGGGLNMRAVRELADVHLENNFSSLSEYETYLTDYFKL
ncbi:AAA family ATPase [Candidatus Saccharibacteria bacterium]|jgi:dephospho-CoA kinase|nr:AAA family ATPase [Candidatus Saccharibacteria bacterium]